MTNGNVVAGWGVGDWGVEASRGRPRRSATWSNGDLVYTVSRLRGLATRVPCLESSRSRPEAELTGAWEHRRQGKRSSSGPQRE